MSNMNDQRTQCGDWRGLSALEPRLLLSGEPFFATPLLNQILPTDGGGLTIGIDGDDPNGDALTLTAVSDDPNINVFIPNANDVTYARFNFEDPNGTPIGSIEGQLFKKRGGQSTQQVITLATTGYDTNGNPDPNEDPYYNGSPVHRVIPTFIVQTGDDNGDGIDSNPLGNVPDEFNLQGNRGDPGNLRFAGQGTIAMANSGPDTNGSQIFFTYSATPDLDFDSGNTSMHMIIGQIYAGFDDVFKDLILSQTVPGSNGMVVDPPIMTSVDIFQSTQDFTVTLVANSNWDGLAHLTVTLQDPQGHQAQQVIELRAFDFLGGPPQFDPIDDLIAVAGEQVSTQVSATDDNGLGVSFDLVSQGTNNMFPRTVDVNADTGQVDVQVPDGFSGIYTVAVNGTEKGFAGFKPQAPLGTFSVLSQDTGDPRIISHIPTTDNAFSSFFDGNKLYIANGYNGIDVYDVTDPADPQMLGTFDAAGESRHVIVTPVDVGGASHDIAVIAATGSGLITLDVTDPANITLGDIVLTTSFTVDVAIKDNVAFIADYENGVSAIDFTDPSDLQIRDTILDLNGSLSFSAATGIALNGNLAYVADSAGQLVTLNISDPDNLQFVDSLSLGGTPFGLTRDGNTLYVADLDGGLVVIDVTTPTQPVVIDRATALSNAFQVSVENGLMVIGTGGGGQFTFADASNRLNLVPLSGFSSSQGAARAAFHGDHVALPSGTNGLVLVDASIFDDTTPPDAALTQADDITQGGGAFEQIVVTYTDTDGFGVHAATIGDGDLRVIGPNGYNELAELVSVNPINSATPMTATYRVPAPSGAWAQADNGQYTVRVRGGAVEDVAGNTVASTTTVGTFNVDVDTTPPVAALTSAPDITESGDAFYDLVITYNDADSPIDTATIDDNDVRVKGPGFNVLAQRVGVVESNGGMTAEVTYRVNAPDAFFHSALDGTYQIRVRSDEVFDTSGNADPATVLVGSFDINITDPGNNILTPLDLGTVFGQATLRDHVGDGDAKDIYKFTLDAETELDVQLTGVTGNTDLRLFDAGGARVIARHGGADKGFRVVIPAGDYFVRVKRLGGTQTTFVLDLNFDQARNSPADARDLGAFSGAASFNDFVGGLDTKDFYTFTLDRTTDLTVQLTGMTDNADLLLQDVGLSQIEASSNSGSADELITATLAAGTYFVRVKGVGAASTDYTLNVFADQAGNDLGAAQDLGVLGAGALQRHDFVGQLDTKDLYQFTINATMQLDLSLSGLSDDADLFLLDAGGAAIDMSQQGGAADEAISQTLSAGTYFVRIKRGAGVDLTNYTLDLTLSLP